MTKITLTRLTELAAEKSARDAQARIAELELRSDAWKESTVLAVNRITHLEAKLREIITDATSREHALTIAREGLE